MLDYEQMIRFVNKLDTTDRDNIKFTVTLSDDQFDDLEHKMSCVLRRRVEGWQVRAELIIDDYVYHSNTVRQDNYDTCSLVKLHNDLMRLDDKRREDLRTANLGWIDTMQELMTERVEQRKRRNMA